MRLAPLLALAFGIPPALAIAQPPAPSASVWEVHRERDPMTDAPTYFASLPADFTTGHGDRPTLMVICKGRVSLAMDAGTPLAADVGTRGLRVRVRYDSAPARAAQWRVQTGTGFAITAPEDGRATVAALLASRGFWIETHDRDGGVFRAHWNTMRAAALAHDVATFPACRGRA